MGPGSSVRRHKRPWNRRLRILLGASGSGGASGGLGSGASGGPGSGAGSGGGGGAGPRLRRRPGGGAVQGAEGLPHAEREEIEQIFKGKSDTINCFVCTQTLELGVDIGALDAVLMRNVPPLPANYWQRAGRAGRRHRIAVNLTYCRAMSHDRAYFAEPLKLL